jgi:hypothetical protein
MAFLTSRTAMSSDRTGRFSSIVVIGFIAALVALLIVGGAGPAYRLELFDLSLAFAVLRWGAWMTRPGTRRRGFALTLAGIVRIEATDTTIWFGFKDDIVVRVTPIGAGSRIDVHSVSRLGQGDLGKNAARIRAYLQRLQQ